MWQHARNVLSPNQLVDSDVFDCRLRNHAERGRSRSTASASTDICIGCWWYDNCGDCSPCRTCGSTPEYFRFSGMQPTEERALRGGGLRTEYAGDGISRIDGRIADVLADKSCGGTCFVESRHCSSRRSESRRKCTPRRSPRFSIWEL